jgi:hypothetical protein
MQTNTVFGSNFGANQQVEPIIDNLYASSRKFICPAPSSPLTAPKTVHGIGGIQIPATIVL